MARILEGSWELPENVNIPQGEDIEGQEESQEEEEAEHEGEEEKEEKEQEGEEEEESGLDAKHNEETKDDRLITIQHNLRDELRKEQYLVENIDETEQTNRNRRKTSYRDFVNNKLYQGTLVHHGPLPNSLLLLAYNDAKTGKTKNGEILDAFKTSQKEHGILQKIYTFYYELFRRSLVGAIKTITDAEANILNKTIERSENKEYFLPNQLIFEPDTHELASPNIFYYRKYKDAAEYKDFINKDIMDIFHASEEKYQIMAFFNEINFKMDEKDQHIAEGKLVAAVRSRPFTNPFLQDVPIFVHGKHDLSPQNIEYYNAQKSLTGNIQYVHATMPFRNSEEKFRAMAFLNAKCAITCDSSLQQPSSSGGKVIPRRRTGVENTLPAHWL